MPNIYHKIVMQFSKEVSFRVYDEFEEEEINEQENGDIITAAYMPEDAWLISYLLSFGANVNVLEPVYLRKVLFEEGKKIYEKINHDI